MQQHCGSKFGFWGAASGISEIPEIFRIIAASACTVRGIIFFQLYEWLCIQVERVLFHSIVAGRFEMWKIGMFYVALGIQPCGGENKRDREGIFCSQKNGMHREKIVYLLSGGGRSFLVVQPVHGFQIWFLDVGQGDGAFSADAG